MWRRLCLIRASTHNDPKIQEQLAVGKQQNLLIANCLAAACSRGKITGNGARKIIKKEDGDSIGDIEMIRSVCSACSGSFYPVMGFYNVIQTFQQFIEENMLHDKIDFKSLFCQK
jgi:hypothetical protein